MHEIILCTFTKDHGIKRGEVKHGFMELCDFELFDVFPEGCIRIDAHHRTLKLKYDDGSSEEIELNYWGISKNIYEACHSIDKLEFPFQCKALINVLFSEFED